MTVVMMMPTFLSFTCQMMKVLATILRPGRRWERLGRRWGETREEVGGGTKEEVGGDQGGGGGDQGGGVLPPALPEVP